MSYNHNAGKNSARKNTIGRVELTAKTKKGMTSIMISVDLIPRALKKPTDPRTETMTTKTPDKPSRTWNSIQLVTKSLHKTEKEVSTLNESLCLNHKADI